MHLSLRWMLGSLVVVAITPWGCIDILGIGDPQLDPTGGAQGGEGGAPVVGGMGGMLGPGECAFDDPLCTQFDADCLALTDNTGQDSYGLRVQQVTIWKPDAFSGGLEYQAVFQAMTLNMPECNLQGGGTINMLIGVDEPLGTVRVGAAKPVTDPFAGYDFVDELVEVDTGVFFNVSPAILSATIDDEGNATTDDVDSISLPLYLSQDASSFILVPVKKAHLFDTQISEDRNCIGRHNDHGLSLDNGCLPDLFADQKPFIEGGKLEGYVLLEEANDIMVYAFGLNRSLCLILAQDAGEFGDGGSPARCSYLNGNIKFPGDWCSTTNAGADPNCHDAVYFGLAFAASAAIIHN